MYDQGIYRINENNMLNRNCLIRELQHVTSQFSIESTSKSDSGRFGFIFLDFIIVTFDSNDKYFF